MIPGYVPNFIQGKLSQVIRDLQFVDTNQKQFCNISALQKYTLQTN